MKIIFENFLIKLINRTSSLCIIKLHEPTKDNMIMLT